MKILAIPATNSPSGLNRQLIDHLAGVATELRPDAEVDVIDLNDYEMPIYSAAREAEHGVPDEAKQLLAKIADADALMISFAEHNGSYTAAWKNTYDWMSRHEKQVYQGKRVAMFAATPGPRAGAGVLGAATMTAPFFGAELVGSQGLGAFYENFDSDAGVVTDPEFAEQLRDVVAALVS